MLTLVFERINLQPFLGVNKMQVNCILWNGLFGISLGLSVGHEASEDPCRLWT